MDTYSCRFCISFQISPDRTDSYRICDYGYETSKDSKPSDFSCTEFQRAKKVFCLRDFRYVSLIQCTTEISLGHWECTVCPNFENNPEKVEKPVSELCLFSCHTKPYRRTNEVICKMNRILKYPDCLSCRIFNEGERLGNSIRRRR